MLARLRDRRRTDRAGAAGHRHDRPELRDRPGGDERAPAPPGAARPRRDLLHAQRRAAELPGSGAYYPLTPEQLAEAPRHLHPRVRARPGRRLLRHDAGAPAPGRRPVRGREVAARDPRRRPAPPASTSRSRSGRTPRTCRSASAPTPTAPRLSARRCSRSAGTTASRSRRTRSATARTCSTSASTTSGVTAPRTCVSSSSRLATASTLPLVIDSTEPAGGRGRAGAARRSSRRQLGQLRGRRRTRVPDRTDDADRPGARRRRRRTDHRRGGPGAHRRVEDPRRRPAHQRPGGRLGHARRGHHRRLPDLPDRHRPGGDPPRRHRDDRGDPRAQAPATRRSRPPWGCPTSPSG